MREPPGTIAESVEISIPSDARYVRLVRLATSAVASIVDADVDTIDDLRVAVDEMCAALIEVARGDKISLRLWLDGDTIGIEGTTVLGDAAALDAERFSLSDQILRVITDDHEFGADGNGSCRFWISRSLAPVQV
ncbi:MAG TPA: ATP-binding protein [Microthrixaceae bacterium]|nr:ATP-binding protein [Microthrixaceae bacterium]